MTIAACTRCCGVIAVRDGRSQRAHHVTLPTVRLPSAVHIGQMGHFCALQSRQSPLAHMGQSNLVHDGQELCTVRYYPSMRDASRFYARLGFAQVLVQRVAPESVHRRRLGSGPGGDVANVLMDDVLRRRNRLRSGPQAMWGCLVQPAYTPTVVPVQYGTGQCC